MTAALLLSRAPRRLRRWVDAALHNARHVPDLKRGDTKCTLAQPKDKFRKAVFKFRESKAELRETGFVFRESKVELRETVFVFGKIKAELRETGFKFREIGAKFRQNGAQLRNNTEKHGYSLAEVGKMTGVKTRTIQYWSARGVFEPPQFRASNTRYEEHHVERLRAIARLRQSGLRLDAVRERLAEEAAEVAQRQRAAEEAKVAAEEQARAEARRLATAISLPTERWERVVLVPGVELHVNLALGPLVRPLVADIRDHALARIAALTSAEPG